jgi:hypothetical protein
MQTLFAQKTQFRPEDYLLFAHVCT